MKLGIFLLNSENDAPHPIAHRLRKGLDENASYSEQYESCAVLFILPETGIRCGVKDLRGMAVLMCRYEWKNT
jgi:hypothetical protein